MLEGKRLVHAHCYRADEILMLIRLADEMGFKIATFQHVLEGYKVAKEIAAHGAGGSTFSDWWAYKVEAIDAIPENAAIMTRKGVLVSINSDSAEHARRLNTEAAKSIKWGGLTEDEAFRMVTINPAKQLRIDNRVGSLEVGKDADVVIWNHHPLSSYAIVDRVYIDGTVYYDRIADEGRLIGAREGEVEPRPPRANRPRACRGRLRPMPAALPIGRRAGPVSTPATAHRASEPRGRDVTGSAAAGGARRECRRRRRHHQRQDSSDHPAGHRARHDRAARQPDRGARRRRRGAARARRSSTLAARRLSRASSTRARKWA